MPPLDPVLDLLRETIPDLAAVYRFGSAATETVHETSDVDLAVLAARPLDALGRATFEMNALSAYALLNEERAGLLMDIRSRGKVRG